jgi:NAD(P)-dependent dehydrogenase (short-subunit alcohol dehydrogenase family)
MTCKKSIENMFLTHMQKFGKLNVLFNNAGIMHSDDDGPVNTEEDVWDLTMNVNLKALFFSHKFGIPHMLNSGGGSIINVASLVALMGSATPQIAYTASKGAVLAMSREMAIMYARDGIRINSLCPGPIRTDLLMKFLSTEEKLNRRLVHIPIGRFGETKEIAQAVAFLASDESSYVTGSSFVVDGGITQAYVTPE